MQFQKVILVSFFVILCSFAFSQDNYSFFLPRVIQWQKLNELTFEGEDSENEYSDFCFFIYDSTEKKLYYCESALNYMIKDSLTLAVEDFKIYKLSCKISPSSSEVISHKNAVFRLIYTKAMVNPKIRKKARINFNYLKVTQLMSNGIIYDRMSNVCDTTKKYLKELLLGRSSSLVTP
jgi:hypothetical protein